MNQVFEKLDSMQIEYEVVNHEPCVTTEEADRFIENIEGVRSKTLFLVGKKKRNYYLVILDDSKKLDIKKFNDIVNDKLSFAKEEELEEKLALKRGYVSLFGILNNKEEDVKIYLDNDIFKEERISFHPNINTATLFIKNEDMLKFIKSMDFGYNIINVD